jgi:hypothetical protein
MVLAVAAGCATVAATPAVAALRFQPQAVSVLNPTTKNKVYLVVPGNRYRFQVDYRVTGAPKIATGHTFVFDHTTSGEQMQVTTKTFPPADPGAYNEAYTFRIPQSWRPGVYTFKWTLSARAVGENTVRATGARSFLVGKRNS